MIGPDNILLGPRRTSVFSRIIAKGIDCLVVVAIFFLGKALWPLLGVGLAVLWCAFQDAMGEGQSVGKRIMGLRVMEGQSSQACGYGCSMLRNIPFVLAVVFGSSPLLWVLFVLVVVPLLAFELFVILSVDSGIRLGDVLGNTMVIEYEDRSGGAFEEP